MRRLKRLIRRGLEWVAPDLVVRIVANRLSSEPVGPAMRYEIELRLLRELCEGEGMLFDVGANVGNYSVMLSTLFGHDRLVSFEPLPNLRRRLQRLLPRVTIAGEALSDSSGHSVIRVPMIGGKKVEGRATVSSNVREVGQTGAVEVPIRLTTLDEFVTRNGISRVAFIKIDVEGHEDRVIAGASTVLSTYQPTLLVEIEQRHHSFPIQRVFDSVLSHGYKGFFVHSGTLELHGIEEFDASIHQAIQAHGTLQYVANFIFLSEGDAARRSLVLASRVARWRKASSGSVL